MLNKLQRKTLVPAQVIGYAITLFVGVLIILITTQLYFDVKPILTSQSDVFKSNYAIVSKNVTVFKTMNKEGIYFSEEELEDLREKEFIKEASIFTSANFKIKAITQERNDMPAFYADLFFESIPDKYLDINTPDWQWKPGDEFIPIIIPEDYLNLYNFGFAESQGLPVLSKNTVSKVEYSVSLAGNGKFGKYRSRIVGFSSKINSILIPQNLMDWANNEYGGTNVTRPSRVLVEFSDPSDKNILKYFNEHDYFINKDKLEFSKLMYFFKSAFVFVLVVAGIIVVLSVAFLLLSINLIIQKNKELFLNLYAIGYNVKSIAKFYQTTVSIVTLASIVIAGLLAIFIRGYYMDSFGSLLDIEKGKSYISVMLSNILVVLELLYYFMIKRSIRKTVEPK